MTREEAKEFAPILQAYAEGKVIECRTDPSSIKSKDTPNNWAELKEIEFWNNTEYRIKLEPKYRPFKDAEECWQEMQKHQPFGWVKDSTSFCHIQQIGFINEDFIKLDGHWYEPDDMFHRVTFLDGTPFGIKRRNSYGMVSNR